MKRTLNLADALLLQGRKLHRLGLHQQALTTLSQLLRLRAVPAGHACEANYRLALLQRRRRRLGRCRRHLTAALLHQPANPCHYYLLGQVTAADLRCDPVQALGHFRQAVKLNPDNPRHLSAYGLLAVKLERTHRGLRSLRRATRLAPDDPVVLKRHVRALWYLRRVKQARTLLHAALFRNPRDARIRRLWDDFQFQVLRVRQEKERHQPSRGDDELCLLPFQPIRLQRRTVTEVVRVDGPGLLPAPHLPLPHTRNDQRFA